LKSSWFALGRVLIALCVVTASAAGASALPARQPDVVVVGGTAAGIAAALAATRNGLRVELDVAGERLGADVTDGMMDQWDYNESPTGQVIQRGIFAEMLARLGDAFAPGPAADGLARWVARSPAITVRYRQVPVRVLAQPSPHGRVVTAIVFATPAGLREAATRFIIDATDDGDVAAETGARYDIGRQDTGRDQKTQAATLMFSLRGVDRALLTSRYDARRFGYGGTHGVRVWGFSTVLRSFHPRDPRVVVRDANFGFTPSGEVTVNAINVLGVNGLDPASEADAVRRAKAETPRLVAFLRSHVPGLARCELARFAGSLYVRETRHFAGLRSLTASAIWFGDEPSDTIGLASYPLDVHASDDATTRGFAAMRHVYGVPFGALVPRGVVNLLLASRAIAASHVAAGSVRTIPTTVEEGEAAGVACALASRQHLMFPALDRLPWIVALQHELRREGAIVETNHAGQNKT
jgi:hypothetical protein